MIINKKSKLVEISKLKIKNDLLIHQDSKISIHELNFLNKFSLYNRLFREGIHNAILINYKVIALFLKGKILFLDIKTKEKLYQVKVKGNRPLNNAIFIYENELYYGEYFSNENRSSVKLMKVNYEKKFHKAVLKFNDIRHIHCAQQNISNSEEVFIGTGDKDHESAIYKFNLKTKKLIKIGGGSQNWRAVSLLQRDNYIYWGSDCPYKQNYIFRYNRETEEREKLFPIDGPAYYSTKNKSNDLFIATTIEDRKKHRAIIYKSSDGTNWNKLIEFKKDLLPEKLFGYGLIEFPQNQKQFEELYVNISGLKKV